MTSFAFIMGVVPLVLSSGAGAEMRHAMGVAVFFGMLGGMKPLKQHGETHAIATQSHGA
jgi:hypothetical protein